MMLPLLLVAMQVSAQPAPPADWSTLPPLPLRTSPKIGASMNQFVANEIAAGRCAKPKPADGHWTIAVPVAVLVSGDGAVRRVLPRAIDCATVENYAAGLVIGFARDNLAVRTGAPDQWFQTQVVFDWHS